MILTVGSTIYDKEKNRYRITEFLGRGGFATVFKVQKDGDASVWAVKTLSESYHDEKLLKGLINEGNLAIQIAHPNVIQYSFFHDGSLFSELPPYILMEFASQGALDGVIKSQRNKKEFIQSTELQRFFNQLIDGMEAINAVLVHRDIKPENILIHNNVLKISDFGLSKVVEEQTRTSTFKGFGTVKYIAPEGWNGGKNSIQMDIYSMGVVFFELATLEHPFKVKDAHEILAWREAHLFQAPQKLERINPAISIKFSQVILKMLEKDVAKRFKTWGEVSIAFAAGEVASTGNAVLVEAILKRRLEEDNRILEENLAKKKKQDEINEYLKGIKYQFDNEVIAPLKQLIDDVNSQYLGQKITIKSESDGKFIIKLVSGMLVILELRSLIDEDFVRTFQVDDYGQRISKTQLKRPLLNKRKVLAWGFLRNQYGKGCNLVLVEREGELYGEWFVLSNTNSGLNRSHRKSVEPFAFDFTEIEREIQLVGVMHVYNTVVSPFEVAIFSKFLDESI